MSLLLAIHSYPSGSGTAKRHWPYFERAGADKIIGVGTVCGYTSWPKGVESVIIGENSYIWEAVLLNRVLDTFEYCLSLPYDRICIAEYDTVFFNPLPHLESGMAAHLAGGKPWGLKCNRFFHNPWLVDRQTAHKVIAGGRTLLDEREWVGGTPDCFLGWLTERFEIPVKTDLWTEFSRNSLDLPGDLDAAREAYRNGVDVIHGVKNQVELDYIISP